MQNSQDKRNDLASLPFALPDLEPGWVWLAGAGPGDPDLLTIKGMKTLQAANVVLYDALVNPQLLDHAPNAEHIFVGKRK